MVVLRKNTRISVLLGSLMLCVLFVFTAHAEESADSGNLMIAGNSVGEDSSDYKLPDGMSYDWASNTLTFTDCNYTNEYAYSNIITYDGTRDLHIQVNGNNTFVAEGDFLECKRRAASGGDIYIEGTGSITYTCRSQDTSEALIVQISQAESVSARDGDIYIDGVTLTSNADGIVSNFSNVSIKNAKLTVNGYQGRKADYGITAGRITSVDYDGAGNYVGSSDIAFGGMLSIENSEIEIRNCITELACTQYKISGNCYAGETSARYSVDTEALFNRKSDYAGGLSRRVAEHGYVRITDQNLGLSKLYRLTAEKGSHGMVTLSCTSATTGETILVTATPDAGYVLDRILVNGEAITGTSFTMPAKDTTVEASFKETPKQQLSKGKVIKNVSGGNYKVTGEGTVEFIKPAGKKTTVKIPDSITKDGIVYRVTSVAANAFKNNKKIVKIVVGKNVQKIGANAFYGCKKLKSVSMNDGIVSIGEKAFYKCTGLTKITLVNSLTSIGKQAFYGCSKLKRIDVWMEKVIKGKIGSKAFSGVNKNVTVNIYNNVTKFASIRKILKSKGMPTAKYKSRIAF